MDEDIQELLELASEAEDLLRMSEPGSDEYALAWKLEICRRHIAKKPCGSYCLRPECQESV